MAQHSGHSIHTSSFITGLNGRSTEGPSWDEPDFVDLIHKMSPSWVRYPAGTQANYWDWRTGTFIEGSGKKPKYKFTIEQCVNGLPENTKLIYVINMARPTPGTGIALDAPAEELMSESTLRKKAQDILDALALFKELGHLPEAIEFGNEFYFDNEHASIYARNHTLYIEHSKILSEIIKEYYPEIDIILCTTKYGTKGRDEWNSAIIEALYSDAEFSSRISGIVQHHYLSENYGSQETIHDDKSAETAIAEALTYVREQNNLNNLNLPDHLKLWLTEYGVSKNNAISTWASGIRSVLMSMAWFESSNMIESMLYHHISADPDVIQKSPTLTLGPVGIAFGLMMKACKGKNNYQQISFSDSDVYGLRISGDSESGILVVNPTGKKITGQNLKYLLPDIELCYQNQFYSERPYIMNVNEESGINNVTTQDYRSYTFYPFSVSWISGLNQESYQGNNNIESPSVIVDRKSKILKISRLEHVPVLITIYDMQGNIIHHETIYKNNESIDLSGWNPGVYIMKLLNENNISVKFKY
ncbi:MAG: T9SS type A sorting domain-containing protein [Bacteroidales bacterium]